jgi:hypothetical protein
MTENKEENMNLRWARYYVHQLHWSVIPLAPGAKIPPKGFEVLPYRERLATDDELESWFSDPRMNVGIVTGKISDLFVVDLDKYKPEYSDAKTLEYFDDNIPGPIVSTPRGGEQLYFKGEEGVTIGAGILPAVDYRGEGGYCVAPPSANGNGGKYSWTQRPDRHGLCNINSSFIKLIKDNIYRGVTPSTDAVLQPVTLSFDQGQRDQSIFHVAHTMSKGGAHPDEIKKVLEILALQCKPPYPKKDIDAKIKSVLERAGRKERNIAQEVACYIAVTDGWFSVTSCYTALQAVTKEDRTAVRVALSRLKDKTIMKHGSQDGVYKRIDDGLEFIDFSAQDDDEEEFPIKLPWNLDRMVEIIQGNIILVAGEFNSGKTSFLLNCLQMNKNRVPIRYLSSEMKKKEFIKRFKGFRLPPEFWANDEMTDYVLKSQDFHTALKPDGLNIIDYLEFRGADFTLGAEMLAQIHDKLTTGVAIVAVQKKEGQRMPRSGDLILEKPRLAISIAKVPSNSDNVIGIAEILKAKNVREGKCDGKKLRFEITEWGSRLHVLNDWGYWRS